MMIVYPFSTFHFCITLVNIRYMKLFSNIFNIFLLFSEIDWAKSRSLEFPNFKLIYLSDRSSLFTVTPMYGATALVIYYRFASHQFYPTLVLYRILRPTSGTDAQIYLKNISLISSLKFCP